jgi:uncharacterized membrane protein YdjX (TVP38/TMEM64 family)
MSEKLLKKKKESHYLKSLLFIALIAAILISLFVWDLSSFFRPDNIQSRLESAGVFAPLLYILVMALAVVISPIPSLPLDIAAGAFFGTFMGTVYSVIGALIGAVISFAIARFLGREFIEKFLGGHVNFCPTCSDKVLTKIVFISRLIPVVSFDIVSYGAGLTKMSIKKFSLATFIGMIPLTFLYNYSGSVLVFGKGLTFVLGIVMVALFFLIPKWMENKGWMKNIKH